MFRNKAEIFYAVILLSIFLLTLIAIIITTAVLYYNRRRRHLLERSKFENAILTTRLEIQEQTFHAISEEIHDNVGQLLSLAKVQIGIVEESERLDKDSLQAIRDTIGKALTDLRDLAGSLNSERIQASGMHEVLAQETDRINRSGALKAHLDVEGTPRDMDPQKKLILFRIVQESIQNCLKHAEATQLSIALRYQPDGIRVSVRDNGKGFDPAVVARSGAGQGSQAGQGLGNIRNRVRLAGGEQQIISSPQEGTRIEVSIPYD